MLNRPLLVFDFFSGTGSSTRAFVAAGHRVVRFELDDSFNADVYGDVSELTVDGLLEEFGRPDFIWASPPCTAFSVAAMGHHWVSGGEFPVPRSEAAASSQVLVSHTLGLIDGLAPQFGWVMENPRGMLRKLPVVSGLPRRTVTYCQYGDERQKPTDLWGGVSGWVARDMCKPGAECHIAAPRGSRTGTQGLASARERSMVPYGLSEELLNAVELLAYV